MKKIYALAVLFCLSAGLFAQSFLTYRNNALVPGSTGTYREIQFADPGNGGVNQIWDFSGIRYTGKNPVSTILDNTARKPEGAADCNILLSDDGYDYYLRSTSGMLEEMGYVNDEKKISLTYSDPLVKMKYPLFYGDSYSDPFSAVAAVGTTRVDFSGNYTLEADAYGTLVLPDRVIKNALRVKTVKKGLQVSQCGSTEISITKYAWYASGFRYPVMCISTIEASYRGGTPEITRTAFVNIQQPAEDGTLAGNDQGKQMDEEGVSVIIFPNPFQEKLTYNYFLRKQLPVTIELFDMTGKFSRKIVKDRIQPEGLHTGEIDAASFGLTPGIYYLRFTFDKQVIVDKIVKI